MDYSTELDVLGKKYPKEEEATLLYELNLARATINRKRRFTIDEENGLYIDPAYRYLLIPMVCASLDKEGVTGQTSHNENGIVRVYGSDGNYPNALLTQIIPRVGTYEMSE